MEAAIRIGILALLVLWSFLIVRPFIALFLWGVIIAVAVFPAYRALVDRLGGRRNLTAALLTIFALVLLLLPAWTFFGGVPARVIIDNLKAAVTKADRYDPVFQRTFDEYAGYL